MADIRLRDASQSSVIHLLSSISQVWSSLSASILRGGCAPNIQSQFCHFHPKSSRARANQLGLQMKKRQFLTSQRRTLQKSILPWRWAMMEQLFESTFLDSCCLDEVIGSWKAILSMIQNPRSSHYVETLNVCKPRLWSRNQCVSPTGK